jgi:hypothetical protein
MAAFFSTLLEEPCVKHSCLSIAATWLLSFSAVAQQAPPVVETTPEGVKAALRPPEVALARPEGWVLTGRAGASLSALHNQNVLGQLDGLTVVGGTLLAGSASLFVGQHEWQNVATYELSLLKSPLFDEVAKSADNLDLRSLYLYRIPAFDWVGPYAGARSFLPLFPGYALPTQSVFTRRIFNDGTEQVKFEEGQRSILLTTWLEPLVVTESAGLFVRPLEKKWLTVDTKAGVGAQQIVSAGGFVVADDAATAELELRQLESQSSAGVELEWALRGVVLGNMGYGLLTTVYYPLLLSQETELSLADRAHVDLTGTLSYRLNKWLSVDYLLRVRRVPFVLNDWQVQNSLLLTVGVSSL